MELVAFILLGLAVLIVILPFAAISKASEAVRHADELAERVRSLESQLNALRKQRSTEETAPEPAPSIFPETEPPPAAEPSTIEQLRTVREESHSQAPVPPTPPDPKPAETIEIKPPALYTQAAQPASESEPIAATPKTESPFAKIQWEQFMGVRLFAWLGGFALFLAAAFFVKYSFDHGLIPPSMRVAIGFVAGIGLLIGGIRMSQKEYKITADTLCATGVVILYSVTFACRSVYHFAFFQPLPTFVVMAVVTTIAFLLSVRLNAMVVAILGMLGGFLTPILVSSGEDNPFGLFTYIALLDVGLIAVAFAARWNWLSLGGAACTVLMQIAWVAAHFTTAKTNTAIVVFLGFCGLFFSSHLWLQRRDRSNVWMNAAALTLPASTFIFAGYLIAGASTSPTPLKLFTLLLGADLAVVGLAICQTRLRVFNQIGGGIVFLLLAIWTVVHVESPLLFWALGGYFGFAVMHTAIPIILHRIKPNEPVSPWAHAFPVITLVITLIPILRLDLSTPVLWMFVSLVSLLAIGLAIIAASIGALLIIIVATAILAFIWVLHLPTDLAILPGALFVLAGYAAVFSAAGIFAGRMILDRQQKLSLDGDRQILPPDWLPSNVQIHVPAFAAIPPFMLLILLAAKLPVENPSALFATALGLSALLLGLTRLLRMDWLPAVGLGCTFLLECTWHGQRFQPEVAGTALTWYVLFYAAYLVFPFVLLRTKADFIVTWSTAALAGVVQFYLVHRLVAEAWPNEFMGVIPAMFMLPTFGGLADLLKQIPAGHPRRNSILAWFGGVGLLFVTLIIPIQFDRQWLTIGWALEGAALLWLFHRIPHPGLRYVGVGLLSIAFVRLALNEAVLGYSPLSEMPILNWYLYAYSCVIAALFIGARLLKEPDTKVFEKDARPLLITLGTILAFLLLNIEIADFFSEPGQRRLTFEFSGNFARDMTYTIGWALFAFVLLLIGILRDKRAARWAGIGLLSVTLLKLFFHDLATLNQLYRVGALVGVAIIAIVVSFLYQKFLNAQTERSDHVSRSEQT